MDDRKVGYAVDVYRAIQRATWKLEEVEADLNRAVRGLSSEDLDEYMCATQDIDHRVDACQVYVDERGDLAPGTIRTYRHNALAGAGFFGHPDCKRQAKTRF